MSTPTSDERCAICTKTRDEHVSITTHKFKDDPRPSNSSNEMLLCAHCGSPSDSLDQQPFPSSRKPDAHWICRCGNPDCGAEIIGRTPEEAIARWNRRVTHETVEQRDGPSTCRQEGHDWKVTCSDCGEVRPIPYVHLNSGGHDRDAKIYSVRDVEALLAVGEAMSRHAHALKAVDQRAIDANALADAHRMYEAEHGHPFSESEPV